MEKRLLVLLLPIGSLLFLEAGPISDRDNLSGLQLERSSLVALAAMGGQEGVSFLQQVPDKLLQVARVIASHPSVEYPEAGVSSPLDEPSAELGRAAAEVLPRPQIAYPDSGILAVLEEPRPGIPPATLPRPCISYSDSAAVFVLELLPQALIPSMAQVKPYLSVTYADAAWSGSLSPPLELLGGRE